MSKDRMAREALILGMLAGWASSQSSVTEGTLDAFVMAVDGLPIEALQHACKRFASGQVPNRNNAFMPSSAELAEQTRLFADVLGQLSGSRSEKLLAVPIGEPIPVGYSPLGPISVDFGQGSIDMRDLTAAEKEEVFRTKRAPDRRLVSELLGSKDTTH